MGLAIAAHVSYYVGRDYVSKVDDLPLHALIRCGPGPDDIVMESMAIGESGATLACPPGAPAKQK